MKERQDPRSRARRRLDALRDAAAATAIGASLACGTGSADEGRGYAVVDPIPAPPSCSAIEPGHLQDRLGPVVTWDERATIKVVVDLSVHLEDAARFDGAPSCTGGKVTVASNDAPRTRILEIAPDARAASIELRIPISCGDKLESVALRIVLDGERKAGASLRWERIASAPPPKEKEARP
ncbi:MAG: hypothetical protein U0166_29385 [Acidobacteriota bacterium]